MKRLGSLVAIVALLVACMAGCSGERAQDPCAGLPDACPTADSSECLDGKIKTCELDTLGCQRWSEESDCQFGTCEDEVSCSVCTSNCQLNGDRECTQNQIRSCEDMGAGCLQWGSFAPCPDDGFCLDGQACTTCNNDCDNEHDTSCALGEIRTCVAAEHGCLSWNQAQLCPTAQCTDEHACADCNDSCPAADATECSAGNIRVCDTDALGCLSWSPQAECPSGACQDANTCADDLPGPAWFLHVTDTHFGESETIGADLATFVTQVIPVVNPTATINTGDTVDSGSAEEWLSYRELFDGLAPEYPTYFELPGNHDVKNDGAPHFLSNSITGRAGGGLYGQTFVDSSAGKIRFVRANTADSSVNFLNIAGIFTQAQADQLSSLPDPAEPLAFTVMTAHHPITGLDKIRLGLPLMLDLLEQYGADLYLSGHSHNETIAWNGNTLNVTCNSLGKSDEPKFMLVSMDTSGPNVRAYGIRDFQWPMVMITTPANKSLAWINPHAVEFVAGQREISVRAIGFSPTGISSAQVRMDEEGWQAMSAISGPVWEAKLTAPDSPGEHTIEVQFESQAGVQLDTATIQVVGP